MRLLQRYVLLELLKTFALTLSIVTVLLVIVGVLREASETGLGPIQIIQILPYVVPSLLPFTVPATLLLTVSVVYGRMAGDQEITAAKAAGISVVSLLWPAFGLGAVLSVCSLVLTDQVIPWAVGNIQTTVTSAMEDIFLDLLRTKRNFNDRAHGIEISVMDVEGKTLIMPVFDYQPPGRTPITIQAQEGMLEFDLQQQQVILHLTHAMINRAGQIQFWNEHIDRSFPLPREIHRPKPRHLCIRDIRQELKTVTAQKARVHDSRDIEVAMALTLGEFERLEQPEFLGYTLSSQSAGARTNRLRTEYHSRFALATSCFFFVLVGGPFSVLQARRQFLTSFFLCFMPILLVYYPVVLLMMNLSKTGNVNPAYAVWLGNLILSVAAYFVLRKVTWH